MFVVYVDTEWMVVVYVDVEWMVVVYVDVKKMIIVYVVHVNLIEHKRLFQNRKERKKGKKEKKLQHKEWLSLANNIFPSI